MQIIECWDVQTWDGADRHNHSFYITSEEQKDAYLAANKYDTAFKVKFVICDTLHEVEFGKLEKLRDSALAKLTAQERKALGV